MRRIITIGREFGSGGRELGLCLSEKLKIAYYDQEIITEIVKKTAFSEQYVREMEEKRPFMVFPLHIGMRFSRMLDWEMEQSTAVYKAQQSVIREMAEKSDCVIVGRCADFILKEWMPFRIFVYASMESRIERCQFHAPVQEFLNERELKRNMAALDQNRADFYEFYTGRKWGERLNYDLCVNTTRVRIGETAELLVKLF